VLSTPPVTTADLSRLTLITPTSVVVIEAFPSEGFLITFTRSHAFAPAGTTTTPFTATGSSTLARYSVEVSAFFELIAPKVRTVISVPAGIVIVCASAAHPSPSCAATMKNVVLISVLFIAE
jgi:hypothetical protein